MVLLSEGLVSCVCVVSCYADCSSRCCDVGAQSSLATRFLSLEFGRHSRSVSPCVFHASSRARAIASVSQCLQPIASKMVLGEPCGPWAYEQRYYEKRSWCWRKPRSRKSPQQHPYDSWTRRVTGCAERVGIVCSNTPQLRAPAPSERRPEREFPVLVW